jgi:hypothetical protein|tara:strand:+ start:342 stop:539 length:198 start_codon:yes stop_codon:yes gene_type:complete
MSNKENITASINDSLKRKLTSELKGATKAETKQQASNVSFTQKRRNAEDMALAKELGVTIGDLIK